MASSWHCLVVTLFQDMETMACKSAYYNSRFPGKKDKESKAMIYDAEIDDSMLMSLLAHPRYNYHYCLLQYPSSTIPLD